eukprot:GHVN01024121.1.p1 GENE.GHVN01024121.1~~GHVN01024121.1.p1  ORF type:complete len:395 (+),score=18.40 GHVN01024121.1:908-2092(+)
MRSSLVGQCSKVLEKPSGCLRAYVSLSTPRLVNENIRDPRTSISEDGRYMRYGGRQTDTVRYRGWQSFRRPPASVAAGFCNKFDHATNPKLWKIEDQLQLKLTEVNPKDSGGHLAETVSDPHSGFGLCHRVEFGESIYHYSRAPEPLFPSTPDFARGELAVGAMTYRTSVWNNKNEPAIASIAKFQPDNFRPMGFAENAPDPKAIFDDSQETMTYKHNLLPEWHANRRPFIYFVQACGMFGLICGSRWFLLEMLRHIVPSKQYWCKLVTEVKLNDIQPGDLAVVKVGPTAVFVRRRTREMVNAAKEVDKEYFGLRDPELDADRVIRDEWLVMNGVCTHLGCVPTTGGNLPHGYLCPCHGSHYDASGRIVEGPAPSNLVIPKYRFIDDDTMQITM